MKTEEEERGLQVVVVGAGEAGKIAELMAKLDQLGIKHELVEQKADFDYNKYQARKELAIAPIALSDCTAMEIENGFRRKGERIRANPNRKPAANKRYADVAKTRSKNKKARKQRRRK